MEGIDSDGHKRTRFPFLATTRYVVAAVVSVLTVVVVVMVTIVALRPEKVIFSIPYQPIEAEPLWWHRHPAPSLSSMTGKPIGGRVAASAVDTNVPATTTTTVVKKTTYSPVKNVSFWVSLTADNPSGRADVSGENVTIRVLDMPNYSYESSSFSFQTLTEIVTCELQDRFTLNRQTSHTLEKWILVNNSAVLSYLADTYGGWTRFTAMVQVNATITSGSGASMKGNPKPQIYYCWPVTVGVSSGYAKSAPCRLEKEMDSPVSFSAPPPAPVPAAAPAPTADAR